MLSHTEKNGIRRPDPRNLNQKIMKPMIKRIFLAGGGSATDSRLLDKHFVTTLDRAKPLIYIPNAMRSKRYTSCLRWFRSTMLAFDVIRIQMWDDLRPRYSVEEIAGIYIGGGDTVKLLREVHKFSFDTYLKKAIKMGVPVYGGSAGAIILGEDIRTASEARRLSASQATSLKVIPKYSIVCHYESTQEIAVRKLIQKLGHNIIAIPEKAGAYLQGSHIKNYGTEQICIFGTQRITQLKPNRTIRL